MTFSLASYEGVAPVSVWAGVVDLFADVFACPPYEEPVQESRRLADWGPARLADLGGRLVVASDGEGVVGFALGYNLSADVSNWHDVIARAVDGPLPWRTTADAYSVRELAVAADRQGRGIGRACLAELLRDRTESHAVLGTYETASQARAAYAGWAFDDLGAIDLFNGVRLHILARPLPWPR